MCARDCPLAHTLHTCVVWLCPLWSHASHLRTEEDERGGGGAPYSKSPLGLFVSPFNKHECLVQPAWVTTVVSSACGVSVKWRLHHRTPGSVFTSSPSRRLIAHGPNNNSVEWSSNLECIHYALVYQPCILGRNHFAASRKKDQPVMTDLSVSKSVNWEYIRKDAVRFSSTYLMIKRMQGVIGSDHFVWKMPGPTCTTQRSIVGFKSKVLNPIFGSRG